MSHRISQGNLSEMHLLFTMFQVQELIKEDFSHTSFHPFFGFFFFFFFLIFRFKTIVHYLLALKVRIYTEKFKDFKQVYKIFFTTFLKLSIYSFHIMIPLTKNCDKIQYLVFSVIKSPKLRVFQSTGITFF